MPASLDDQLERTVRLRHRRAPRAAEARSMQSAPEYTSALTWIAGSAPTPASRARTPACSSPPVDRPQADPLQHRSSGASHTRRRRSAPSPRRRGPDRRRTSGESRQRERHRAPDALGVGGRERCQPGVRLGHAAGQRSGLQPVLGGLTLDRLPIGSRRDPRARRRAPAPTRGRSEARTSSARRRGSTPGFRGRSRRSAGLRVALRPPDQPWINQPSAARAASMTASDSVG